MKELILVKFGGSVITDKKKSYFLRRGTLARLVKEIGEARKKLKGNLIIGHGAGSFAHIPAHKYRTKEGIIDKNSVYGLSVTGEAARMLNAIVVQNFVSQKIPALSFSPLSFLTSDRQVLLKSYIDPIYFLLSIGSIPVVYGDVIMDKSRGFTIFSTEKVFSVIIDALHKKYRMKVILVTDVDGVHDDKGKNIPRVTPGNFRLVKKAILGSGSVDVTGGMLHKVEESLELAKKYNVETLIINGNVEGNLKKAILGKKVTSTFISKHVGINRD